MSIDEPALKVFGSIGIIISGGIILFALGQIIIKISKGEMPFPYTFTEFGGWLLTPKSDKTVHEPVFGVNPGLDVAGIATTRWDLFYLSRWVFGLTALVYISYCIQDLMTYPATHPCMQRESYIRDLFIAFVFFLMVLFFVNTLTAYQLSFLLTGIMRYLVPPTALALAGTLIYYANDLSKLSPNALVE